MTKKECKDGECRVGIPDLSVEDDTEKKVDKKDWKYIRISKKISY